jgi:TIR domain
MTIDLDQLFVDEEEVVSESRVFPHDLFISHRRFDSSLEMVEALSTHKISVVWDCNLDLRDRRVMQCIARAMRRSRFVGLYVSNGYQDSPWCRAEYLNALWVEAKYKIQRTLVISESSQSLSNVPKCLRAAPTFVANEVGRIAQFLASGNLPGENSAAERLRREVPAERLSQDAELLSFDERLNILEQRMLFWAENGNEGISFSKKDDAAKTLAALLSDPIIEPEIIFREVSAIVFTRGLNSDRRPGIGDAEFCRVVSMVECMAACYSIPARAPDLTGIDKWAYDFILKPLLLAAEHGATRATAAATYRVMCSVLCLGPFRHEVPVYLSVLAAVESGRQNVRSAVHSHRVELIEAAEFNRR